MPRSLVANCVGTHFTTGFAKRTDALKIAFRALNNGPGSELIIGFHTVVTSVKTGAIPVLIGADTIFYTLNRYQSDAVNRVIKLLQLNVDEAERQQFAT